MKKIILGLLSVLLLGQVSWAQPVSDMAVIPMGITVQSVMRLTITKGGNIEFVFKSARDIENGVPASDFGPAFETQGIISASQNWVLNLTVDETTFIGEDGANNLSLHVVDFYVETLPDNCVRSVPPNTPTNLDQNVANIIAPSASSDNLGTGLKFAIQWRCGHNPDRIPGSSVAQRYSANVVLTLEKAL